MKILYLYRYCILGGVSTQLVNRLRYLGDRAEVHFGFIHDYGGRVAFGDHPWVHLLGTPGRVTGLVAEGGFDAVLPIDTPEVYAPIHAAGYQGPVINEVHTTTSNLRYLEELRGEQITAFFSPSRYLVGRIEDEFGFAGEVPAHYTANCLDTDLFQPLEVRPVPRRRVVLWIGKLDDHKNWRGFVEAAANLAERRDDCEFWMVGGETAKDEVAGELLDEVAGYDLMTRFRWLQRVEYATMPRLYSLVAASGGLSLSTSRDESFGMTLVESLACGCPTVGAAVGALPEILDGEFGVHLYPYFDVDRLLAVVEQVLDRTPQEASRWAELGRRRVVERYSIAAAGSAYYKALSDVVSARPHLATA